MLEEIKTFVQVVELNSFTKAAKKLHISPPMVTRRIAQLEETLAVKLLQRNTRQLTVTEAGRLFYIASVDMLNTYASVAEQVHHLSHQLAGTLKVGLPASINYLYVIPALSNFLSQHPELSVQIVQGNHLVGLLSEGFDLVVHCGKLPDSSFYSKQIATWTKVTCASPAYLASRNELHHPVELAQHNCLDHINNYSSGWYYHINHQNELIQINGNIRLDSSLALKKAALADLGIVYLPSFTVKKEIASGQLISILSAYQPPPLDIFVIYPNKQFINQKTKAFIEFLISLDMEV